MATFLVSTVAESVEKIGGELSVEEYKFLRGARGEVVDSIKTELSRMQDFLTDANTKGKQGKKMAEREDAFTRDEIGKASSTPSWE
ncbi:hypothetical protein ACLOJK_041576 [Asimina triloba]